MNASRLVIALALAAALSPLRAARGQDARLERRLDAETRARVAMIIDSARAAGLPVEPLVDKALEGASKRATGDRIVAAVRNLAADLTTARQALGPASTGAELDAGASALHAGVRPDALAQLRSARRRELTVPLAVLADLVARGVPVDSATSFVLALAGSAGDAAFVAFQREVDRDIALGAPPVAAAAVRVNNTLREAAGFQTGVGNNPPRKP